LQVQGLLQAYAYQNAKLHWEFVDPVREVARARYYQINEQGTLVVESGNRLARLDADLATGRAGFTLMIGTGSGELALADVQLTERVDIDGRRLHESMFRHGRGVRPLGLRNGIRATVYPMSQVARRLRGG